MSAQPAPDRGGRDVGAVPAPALDAAPDYRERDARRLAGAAAALGGVIGFVWLVVGPGWWQFARPWIDGSVWMGDSLVLAMGVGGAGLVYTAFQCWRALDGGDEAPAPRFRAMAGYALLAGAPGLAVTGLHASAAAAGPDEWLSSGGLAGLLIGLGLALPALLAPASFLLGRQVAFALPSEAAGRTRMRVRRLATGVVGLALLLGLGVVLGWPGRPAVPPDIRGRDGVSTRAWTSASGPSVAGVASLIEEGGAAGLVALIAMREAEHESVRRRAAEAIVGWCDLAANPHQVPLWVRPGVDEALAGLRASRRNTAAYSDPPFDPVFLKDARLESALIVALSAWDSTASVRFAPALLAWSLDPGPGPMADEHRLLALAALADCGVRARSQLPGDWKTRLAGMGAAESCEVRLWAAFVRDRIEPDVASMEGMVGAALTALGPEVGAPSPGLRNAVLFLVNRCELRSYGDTLRGLAGSGASGARLLDAVGRRRADAAWPEDDLDRLIAVMGAGGEESRRRAVIASCNWDDWTDAVLRARIEARLSTAPPDPQREILGRALSVLGAPARAAPVAGSRGAGPDSDPSTLFADLGTRARSSDTSVAVPARERLLQVALAGPGPGDVHRAALAVVLPADVREPDPEILERLIAAVERHSDQVCPGGLGRDWGCEGKRLDDTPCVQCVWNALDRAGSAPVVIRMYERALRSSRADVRARAAESLADLGAVTPALAEALKRVLAGADPVAKLWAATRMAYRGSQDPAVVRALAALADSLDLTLPLLDRPLENFRAKRAIRPNVAALVRAHIGSEDAPTREAAKVLARWLKWPEGDAPPAAEGGPR